MRAPVKWLIALAFALPGLLCAQISETILSMAVTNYTGYVIDADADDLNFLRETLRVQSRIQYTNSAASSTSVTYRVICRLLDTNNVAHPLVTGTNTFGFTLNANSSRVVTNLTQVRPAPRLNPYNQYKVELRLYRVVSGTNLFTGRVTNDSPQTYYHFTNRVSGDSPFNIIATLDGASFSRDYAVKTDPSKNVFQVEVDSTFRRYDNFDTTNNPSATVPFTLTFELRNATNQAVIPLKTNVAYFTRLIRGYDPPPPSNPYSPAVVSGVRTINIEPADGVQLDSVKSNYLVRVTIAHTEDTNTQTVVTGNTGSTPAERLLHFNGNLLFGSIQTIFTSIDNNPTNAGVVTGQYVNTHLGVDGNSGYVVTRTNHTYGDGTDLPVRLRANGDAEYSGASAVTLNGPAPDLDNINRVRFERLGPTTLHTNGARSLIRATLPTGFGYRLGNTNQPLTLGQVDFGSLSLNQSLRPTGSPVYFPPGVPIFGCEETKPVWIESDRITWLVSQGRFTLSPVGGEIHYVRWDEFDYLRLQEPVLANSMKGLKRSNERYFEFVDSVASTIVEVRTDANGIARMDFDIGFLPMGGIFQSHFPYDVQVQWTGGGQMLITDDLVQPAGSLLTNVNTLAVPYSPNCTGCVADAGLKMPTLTPSNNVLNFTRDGGLVAMGTNAPTELMWGYFTNATTTNFAGRSFTYTAGNFHMPGAFMRGDQVAVTNDKRAGVLLYTGVAATNWSYLEREDLDATANHANYLRGHADYAGLNFAVGADGAKQGSSYLAGVPSGNYQLTGRSKYYVRHGGVSGIHEAVPGSFPTNMTLYGYPVQFSNYGLSYLDSVTHESRTDGSISVPYPSQFTQDFEELRFSCVGGLTFSEVPDSDADKELKYWIADFSTLAIAFQRNPGEECDPSRGSLVLGVAMYPHNLNQPIYGSVGFQTNGNLIPKSFGLQGIDSRLTPPNVVKTGGPAEEEYSFNPVSRAYLNSYVDTPPEVGFITLAGTIDVPFFEDLKAHLHTSADGEGTNAAIYLMGGWPNHGWPNAGDNYFTITDPSDFDTDNIGYPGGDVASYRDSQTENYHPRAQKTWLEVVDFDYPLKWDTTTRAFTSRSPVTNKLLVVNVEHQCKYLSAENAELTFGIEYEGLPDINIASLAFNAIDEATGVASAMTETIGETARGEIEDGLDRLNQMLADQLHELFDHVLDSTIDPIIGDLYNQLSNTWATVPVDQWPSNVSYQVQLYVQGVNSTTQQHIDQALMQVGDIASAGTNLIERIDSYLLQAQTAISNVQDIIKEEGGERHIASALIQHLVEDIAPDFVASILGAIADGTVNSLLEDADPALDRIYETLGDINSQIASVRSGLDAASGLGTEINDRLADAGTQISTLTANISRDVTNFFNQIDYSIDDPFQQYSVQEIKATIRRSVEDHFFGADVMGEIQTALKQRLYELDNLLREAIDSAFQQVNDVMKDVISQTLAELDDSISGFADDLNSAMGAGSINGYAHINNDALKELRLDMHAQFKVPDNMEFNAYLLIKELDSQGTDGCNYGGAASLTEVSVGATDVTLDWLSPGLRANVGTKFTFGNNRALKGMAGSLELNGSLSFETFEITYLGAAVAFGAEENYFSAACGLRFNQYEGFGGIYFGRTCTLDPIELWDPLVADVLGEPNPSFTGAYGYAEAWIPISELIGIPATCLFYVSAGVGAGAGYFVEGPTYIGKMKAGVSGEALCIVSVRGDVTMVGVKQGDDFRFAGTGRIKGKAGSCPLCVKFKKNVTLTLKNGQWDVDY